MTVVLDVAEAARIGRSEFGLRPSLLFGFGLTLVIGLIDGLVFVRQHQSFGWPVVVFWVVYLALFLYQLGWQRSAIAPQTATNVVVSNNGIEIGGPACKTRVVPFSEIRSVQGTRDAFILWKKARPFLIIPKRALPDGGAALRVFLEDRLIGKRMLHRSAGASTIVNTAPRS